MTLASASIAAGLVLATFFAEIMAVTSEVLPEVTVESAIARASVRRACRSTCTASSFIVASRSTMPARRVPYLAALGVTDFYSSPFLTAGRGSTHGYDIADHGKLNEELGGEAGFDALSRRARDAGMGFVLDIVPNHMGVEPERNHWWRDVLENGPSSIYARFFDIDWTPLKPELTDKVLLPILGDQYGAVLERGELQLGFRDGALRPALLRSRAAAQSAARRRAAQTRRRTPPRKAG